MPAERYYLDIPLKKGLSFKIEGSEHHHLAHVMRAKAGQHVEVVNGRGILAQAHVDHVGRRDADLTAISIYQQPAEQTAFYIAQAVPRLNRLDTILEKATELGMAGLLLFPAVRSERKKLDDKQLQRARGVMASAMKQCGRLYLPKLEYVSSMELFACKGQVLFGDVNPEAPLFIDEIKKLDFDQPITFFVGPESGFNEQEHHILRDEIGAKGVKLHRNILRTDTASLVVLSLLDQQYLSQSQ